MTTTVTVKTHNWPAKVMGFPKQDGVPVEGAEYQEIGEVAPDSERTFHPHAGLDLLIQEMPLQASEPITDAE